MATKDFYKTLGVSETASADEIKKAYRKLAKKLHPDVTGGDKAKEAKFKELTEANETLGDEKKRAAYDEARRNPFGAGGGFPGGAHPGAGGGFPGGGAAGFDVNDLFSQFGGRPGGGAGGRVYTYSSGGGGGGVPGGEGDLGDIFDMFRGAGADGGRTARQQPRRGGDVVAKLDIDLPEAALGAEKHVTVDGRSLKIKIPPGVGDGKTIRLAGQGQPAPRGGQPGDLLIELSERPHPRFRRSPQNPADIEVDAQVPVDVAVLGGKAQVPTLEGTNVTLSIPPGSSSGRKLRLKEKGAAQGNGKPRGDLYANVSVQVPSEISPEAREAMEQFAKLTKK